MAPRRGACCPPRRRALGRGGARRRRNLLGAGIARRRLHLEVPVTSTRSGGAPRLMIRRASSSDCMQKSVMSCQHPPEERGGPACSGGRDRSGDLDRSRARRDLRLAQSPQEIGPQPVSSAMKQPGSTRADGAAGRRRPKSSGNVTSPRPPSAGPAPATRAPVAVTVETTMSAAGHRAAERLHQRNRRHHLSSPTPRTQQRPAGAGGGGTRMNPKRPGARPDSPRPRPCASRNRQEISREPEARGRRYRAGYIALRRPRGPPRPLHVGSSPPARWRSPRSPLGVARDGDGLAEHDAPPGRTGAAR